MRYAHPSEPAPEDMYNVTVSFTDEEPDILVTEVTESELVGMYCYLGEPAARVRLQPAPGHHYMTAASRIKHIKAELIPKESN